MIFEGEDYLRGKEMTVRQVQILAQIAQFGRAPNYRFWGPKFKSPSVPSLYLYPVII